MPHLEKFGSIGAYFSNVLQPVMVFLSIFLFTQQPGMYKIFGGILISMYILYLIITYLKTSAQERENVFYVSKTSSCRHLDYGWWKKMHSGAVYLAVLVLLLLLAKPLQIFHTQLIFILLVLIIAMGTRMRCGIASSWCFLAALAPVMSYCQFKILKM